jgi:hypothetical protein
MPHSTYLFDEYDRRVSASAFKDKLLMDNNKVNETEDNKAENNDTEDNTQTIFQIESNIGVLWLSLGLTSNNNATTPGSFDTTSGFSRSK